MDALIFGDLASDLLETARACLATTTSGEPSDVFVGHGDVPRWCCDTLTVWVGPVVLTQYEQFPTPLLRPPRCDESAISAQLNLKLRRNCFPFLKAPPEVFPEASALTEASINLAEDARVLYCCVVNAYEAGTLFTEFADTEPPESYVTVFGPMLPYRGGACAGWDWSMRVGIPVCCPDD